MKNEVLNFLFQHIDKCYTSGEWCKLLNVYIIDPDGWRGRLDPNWSDEICITRFIRCLSRSTINLGEVYYDNPAT
jgi:hypothetical protein